MAQTVSQLHFWILGLINAGLLAVASFLIRDWIRNIKADVLCQATELKELKDRVTDEHSKINEEVGKRKGEIELLKKDVEKLSSDTNHNFESLKTHLNYQKQALEEIKADSKERKIEMDKNFQKLIEIVNKK